MTVAHEHALVTNASINRSAAMRLLKAGFTVAEICKAFARVWKNKNGKLSQKYHGNLGIDSHGRKETTYTIHREAVDELIAARGE